MLGFPDGHLTSYEKDTYVLRLVLVAACAVQGLYFLIIGAISKGTKIVGLWLRIVVAAAVIVAPVVIVPNCSQVPACVHVYELIMKTPMDDGAGG